MDETMPAVCRWLTLVASLHLVFISPLGVGLKSLTINGKQPSSNTVGLQYNYDYCLVITYTGSPPSPFISAFSAEVNMWGLSLVTTFFVYELQVNFHLFYVITLLRVRQMVPVGVQYHTVYPKI